MSSLEMVFVYDIDILTMLSKNNLDVLKRVRPHVPAHMIKHYLDNYLTECGLNDSNPLEVINIEHVVDDGSNSSKQILANYEKLKYMYNCKLDDLRDQMDTVTKYFPKLSFFVDRWKCAKKCLQFFDGNFDQTQRDKFANVVLCKDGVAHGAIELALSGLASEVPLENIYSTATRSTEDVLEIIQKRFGKICRLTVITSNGETVSAAGNVKLPLHHQFVSCNEDFDNLYIRQRKRWLPQKQQEDKQPSSSEPLLDENNNVSEPFVQNDQLTLKQQKQRELEDVYEAVLESTNQYERLIEFRRQREQPHSKPLFFIHGNRSGSAVFRPQQQSKHH